MKYQGPVDKANMRLWVAGLRSGIFAQTRQCLKGREDGGPFGYCCMGVVCEIARIRGIEIQEDPSYWAEGTYVIEGSAGFLRNKVIQWLGLPKESGDVNPIVTEIDGVLIRASEANDDREWDFLRIADELENYYGLNEPEEEQAGDTTEVD